ncbi:hypothetical protein FS837_008376 [Tulasnella sp. UAMH 9824]|nr:hypothetical protein FS837_008376 [Tulasnella sp. UAMH 9824]
MAAVGTFNTKQIHLDHCPQKENSGVIRFPQTYVAPPRVALGLSALDIENGTKIRVKSYTDDITSQDFTAHIDTWGDTSLYSGEVNYFAMKPANLDFQTGTFQATQDFGEGTVLGKKTSHRVTYDRPFLTPPRVVVFLREVSLNGDKDWCIKTYASNIDTKGFTLHFDTSGDTIVDSVGAGWIAYPEDRDHICSGTGHTTEVSPRHHPHEKHQKDVVFQGVHFWRNPRVFVALNSFDMSSEADLRCRAYCDNVTTNGLTWHIDTWRDSKLKSAGISYICFN